MTRPVFISYARRATRAHATALHAALGGEEEGLAFLDTVEIEQGEQFPQVLAEAVSNAKVVVIFAEKTYFVRWYCLRELLLALSGYLELFDRGTPDPADLESALHHIVIALHPSEGSESIVNLPPLLQTTNWPTMDQTAALAALVRKRLADLDSRSMVHSRAERPEMKSLLEASALPPPGSLQGIRLFPPEMPTSLGDGFVGRADDLWRIHFTLSVMRGGEAGGAPRSAALHAAGGFGKTRLAAEYVWRFGPRHYPGGIFWVDADVPPNQLISRLHGILQTLQPDALDLPEFVRAGLDVRLELAQALQRQTSGQPVLYVVDNVPEPPAGEPPRSLRHWCPAVGLVTLLATSRLRIASEASVRPLPVDALTPEGALRLLTRGLVSGMLAEHEWRRIAESVGHLPLALELLNSALAAASLTPGEVLARLQHGVTRELDAQMDALRDHVPEGVLRGITEAFRVSYDRLSEPQQRGARLVAQLAPEPIPERLAGALVETLTPPVKVALRARAFVTPMAGAVPIFGKMHRVLADFLRAQGAGDADQLHAAGVALAGLLEPSQSLDPKRWSELRPLVPHAEVVFDRLRHSAVGDQASAVKLGIRLGLLLHTQGLWDEARRLRELTATLADTVLGPEHPDTLAAITNLAETLHDAGELTQARTLQERVRNAYLKSEGPGGPNTVAVTGNLARTLHDQGHLRGAQLLEEGVLIARRGFLGSDHEDTLAAMLNLAVTRFGLGDKAAARKLQEEALTISERVLGTVHPTTLTAMNNLASTLLALRELGKARTLLARVLEVNTELLGREHPSTLASKANLAGVLREEGQLHDARKHEEEALEVLTRRLGPTHPQTLALMGNLAVTLKAEGDLSGARKLEEHVLSTIASTSRLDHPDRSRAAWNLMSTLVRMDDASGAARVVAGHLAWLASADASALTTDQQRFREQVVQIVPERIQHHFANGVGEPTDQDGSRTVVMALVNKGTILLQEGHVEDAITAYDDALTLDPTFFVAWANKGTALAQAGRRPEAIEAYQKAVSLQPDIDFVQAALGQSLGLLGRHREALEHLERAIALSLDTTGVWFDKGVAHQALGEWQLAVSAYEKSVSLDSTNHAAWNNLGAARLQLGLEDGAIQALERVRDLRPRDADAWDNLGIAYARSGRHEDALHACDETLRIESGRARTWYRRGRALEDLGRPDEALDSYAKAIAVDDRFVDAWSRQGLTFFQLGRIGDAIQSFAQAVAYQGENPENWYNLAAALVRAGNTSDAVAALRNALVIRPNDDRARSALVALGADPENL